MNKYKTITKNKLYQYYDEEKCIRISIFKSGFVNFYTCVEEDPYIGAKLNTYSAQEIFMEYGIDVFLRKEKLINLNNL